MPTPNVRKGANSRQQSSVPRPYVYERRIDALCRNYLECLSLVSKDRGATRALVGQHIEALHRLADELRNQNPQLPMAVATIAPQVGFQHCWNRLLVEIVSAQVTMENLAA